MKTKHIITGPENACLCGVYGGKAVSCQDILNSIETVKIHYGNDPRTNLLDSVFSALTKEAQSP